MSTIFGPVHSRRFGVSLGIDLSPSHKQCNFDCLYCELAPAATVDVQNETPSVESIITDLKAALKEHNNIDEITLTANGEPTLYPHLKELISEIDKIKEDKETLILTNSAALVDKKVFDTLLELDQVKLSLDAVSTDIFRKIDRPHDDIDISRLVDAVVRFSEVYTGKLFIEILFVRGLNDTKEEIVKLNEVLHRLKALRIDIGTIDRPPAYPVEGISYGELVTIAQQFDADMPINIASRVHAEFSQSSYTEEEIINTLDKRPLTPEDVEILFD
ncbi:MAG: radical SAM protein, partial [Campylobacterota bacterium]